MNKLLLASLWEAAWWVRRKAERQRVFVEAAARAKALDLPLVVVGAPDLGPTMGPGCGDLTIDIDPGSACPNFLRADITRPLPLGTRSAVVFVSCVLEYVDDFKAAMVELRRVAGDELYNVRVEPWTLVFMGIGYQPCKRLLPWPNGRVPR